ncbi:MAG: flagellar FliJ family protein [Phycisphaerales bacterium]|nr:flagellar FliJ family protein [Phycisphaerales bacterium]
MPRFRFQLEPLLKARRRAEEQRQIELARLEAERTRLEHLIRQRQEDLSEGREALRGVLVGRLDAAALRLHAGSAVQVMRQGHQLVLRMAGVTKSIVRAREALAEAAKQRRAIELLRERRFEEWRQGLDRAENNALDELAVMAAGRPADLGKDRRPDSPNAFRPVPNADQQDDTP